jgi:hypothetical protein
MLPSPQEAIAHYRIQDLRDQAAQARLAARLRAARRARRRAAKQQPAPPPCPDTEAAAPGTARLPASEHSRGAR